MPTTVTQTLTAEVPTVDDLRSYFPHYVGFAQGAGRRIFESVCSPLGLELAKSATRNGLPAVAGVVELCERSEPGWQWTAFSKQFLGGVTRVLMTVNGYSTTGTKRNIPHPQFTRGEVYVSA